MAATTMTAFWDIVPSNLTELGLLPLMILILEHYLLCLQPLTHISLLQKYQHIIFNYISIKHRPRRSVTSGPCTTHGVQQSGTLNNLNRFVMDNPQHIFTVLTLHFDIRAFFSRALLSWIKVN
jgi:hypothetical protein